MLYLLGGYRGHVLAELVKELILLILEIIEVYLTKFQFVKTKQRISLSKKKNIYKKGI